MIGGTANAPPSLAALSEARQLLVMLDDHRWLGKQLEKLASGAAEFRAAEADARKAIAAAKAAKAESERALKEIAASATAFARDLES
jgi:hypothetical protein